MSELTEEEFEKEFERLRDELKTMKIKPASQYGCLRNPHPPWL